MPYALFANAVKISKAFPAKSDVWHHAEEAGLVTELGLGEEDPPRRILDMGYAIRECPADSAEAHVGGMSEDDISQMIAACRANPPSANAAS